MSSRDYLRKEGAQIEVIQSIQQAVELMGGGEPLATTGGAGGRESEVFAVSLEFEQNLNRIEKEEGNEALCQYFAANPTHISAVQLILDETHRALQLIHFYTASEREVKCWCLKQGKTILESSSIVDINVTR